MIIVTILNVVSLEESFDHTVVCNQCPLVARVFDSCT